ncbi:MAG: amidohydrolase [Oscillospiraceae bacterium]|nr:amidohydrolase [Oscillospiraceae bacterium]
MLIYNAKIDPVVSPVIENGYISVENGRIAAVCEGIPPKISEGDIDCGGMLLMPGFIDSHSHIGFIGDGAGMEGEDVNESSDPVTPHLRAIDGLNFTDGYFKDAVRFGVTCAVTGCGSANPIGGDFIAVKTWGRCADEMLIRQAGIKLALGENPKSCYSDRDEAPMTRMATAALIREALFTAQRYMEQKQSAAEEDGDAPDFDMKSEALIPLLKREIKAHFHCHRADDIMTAVRIAEEFGLDYVLVHCTEGHLIADILGEKGVSANIGPVICDRGKPELARLTVKNAAVLHEHGVKISVCTDHPEVPLDYLTASAAFCVKAGLPRKEAIKAITVNAAEITGISDRTGSISVGLDADLVLLDGDPLDIMTNVVMTFIEGKCVYKKEHIL